jgi:hypothetical protein
MALLVLLRSAVERNTWLVKTHSETPTGNKAQDLMFDGADSLTEYSLNYITDVSISG